jgi:hypothetical protein
VKPQESEQIVDASGIVEHPSLMRPSPNEGHGFGGIVVERQAAVVERVPPLAL